MNIVSYFQTVLTAGLASNVCILFNLYRSCDRNRMKKSTKHKIIKKYMKNKKSKEKQSEEKIQDLTVNQKWCIVFFFIFGGLSVGIDFLCLFKPSFAVYLPFSILSTVLTLCDLHYIVYHIYVDMKVNNFFHIILWSWGISMVVCDLFSNFIATTTEVLLGLIAVAQLLISSVLIGYIIEIVKNGGSKIGRKSIYIFGLCLLCVTYFLMTMKKEQLSNDSTSSLDISTRVKGIPKKDKCQLKNIKRIVSQKLK